MTSPKSSPEPLNDLNRPADADPDMWIERIGSAYTCHCRDRRDDKQFERVRYTKPHVRLYGPRALAQIESDVRDERVYVEAAA